MMARDRMTPDDEYDDARPANLGDRLRSTFLKPPKPGSDDYWDEPQTVEEIEAAIRSASDKERAIGLIAAPLAAAIGLVIIGSLISNDPAHYLANGQLNPKWTNPSLYGEVRLVLLAMSMLALAFAWWRKRLFLGITLALYGLAIFNLKFWGFGVPFLLAGGWYLTRAYKLQRSLREASGGFAGPGGSRRSVSRRGPSRPSASKRYTPPSNR